MGSILSRFLEIAADGDRIAVVDGSRRVTYGTLLDTAHQVADLIPDSASFLVGLRMERNWTAIAAMIGTLIKKRAYVPIDPWYPDERQQYIASDARVSHIISNADDDLQVEVFADTSRPGHSVPPDTMYVIYTSGSTGTPKGVTVTQNNVNSLLEAAMTDLPLESGLRWSVFHSLSFDFSVWEVWGSLLSGGCAVLVDRESAIDPFLLTDILLRERVNVLSIVPSGFSILLREVATAGHVLPDLRCVIFGGEAIRPNDITEWWRAQVSQNCSMINMYGITETTVHVTQCVLTPQILGEMSPGRTPIGSPLSNAEVKISRDGGATSCPPGQTGEIIVFGNGLAAGYLGRPALTNERFPIIAGKRAYHSGDLGVYTPEGSLAYVGRNDEQVKIRGYRIELGEVESILANHIAVEAAACAVYPGPDHSDRLVACIVGRGDKLDTRNLRRWLANRVPSYLMPARFVAVDSLPITDNGKLDRGALTKMVAALFDTPN